MRILLIGAFPPPYGGVQTHLAALQEFLRQRGHCCAGINVTRHRRPEPDAVHYPKTAAEVLRLLWRLPCEIVHLHIGGQLSLRWLGLCLACSMLPGRKTVVTFHSGGYPDSPAGRAAGYWTLPGWVFRRLDRAVGVNPRIVDLFHRWGLPPGQVRLIPPHALPGQLPETEWPEPLRRFFDAHAPVLLSVGLLEPEYDLPLQIELLGRLRAKFPRAGLALIGSGSLEEPLRRHIQAQPWREHVLLYGDLPHPVTLQAIARCDVLLRTTWYDGDAISVREALHWGTPVVATDTGMRPPGVRLAPVSDLEALAAAVEEELLRGRRAPTAAPVQENLAAVEALYRELV